MSFQSTTVGDVCFIRNNGNVLLLCRKKKLMHGKWTGVGGKTLFFEEPLESCVREVREETGLEIKPILRAIVTTIDATNSSKWLLFVYVANGFSGNLRHCDEGTLEWVDEAKILDKNLIGFIRVMLPLILDNEEQILTGKIIHDEQGNVHNCALRRGVKDLIS